MKLLFCRVGWMESYKGVDKISGGGKFVDEGGIGFECFNFKPFKGRVYGFPGLYSDCNLNMTRLGADFNQTSINNVTIVWFSKKPGKGGQYIVGWYRNATVYKNYQSNLPKSVMPKLKMDFWVC